MLPGDECADPDYPGLRVRRTNAARVSFYRYRAALGRGGRCTLARAVWTIRETMNAETHDITLPRHAVD